MSTPAVPPGWPAEVPSPGAPEWERRAVGFLFDQCPGEYRSYDVLRAYPLALGRLAAEAVAAARDAARRGLATARRDLAHDLPPRALEALVAAYEREGARLARVAREVDLVREALAGGRYVPRL